MPFSSKKFRNFRQSGSMLENFSVSIYFVHFFLTSPLPRSRQRKKFHLEILPHPRPSLDKGLTISVTASDFVSRRYSYWCTCVFYRKKRMKILFHFSKMERGAILSFGVKMTSGRTLLSYHASCLSATKSRTVFLCNLLLYRMSNVFSINTKPQHWRALSVCLNH